MGNKEINDRQRRLAMVIEMIHVASLVHDDVLDECDVRRGASTVNDSFGNKVAVLVGDFLFAQSSWYLANLDNLEVIKLISQVIADFADGEIAQAASLYNLDMSMEQYLDKSFYKTASLIAAACRSAAVLSDVDDQVKEAMYAYGKHLGLAFQVVDDILDFTQSTEQLGKPQGQDLATGNLTAPTLFALQAEAEMAETSSSAPSARGNGNGSGNDRTTTTLPLRAMIQGKFSDGAQLQDGVRLVEQLGGISAARAMARQEGRKAVAALTCLPMCSAKESLIKTVDYVLDRLH
jgi:all-trans-nonaprenyl-diphosphate synthase